jgi:hypothetical protein
VVGSPLRSGGRCPRIASPGRQWCAIARWAVCEVSPFCPTNHTPTRQQTHASNPCGYDKAPKVVAFGNRVMRGEISCGSRSNAAKLERNLGNRPRIRLLPGSGVCRLTEPSKNHLAGWFFRFCRRGYAGTYFAVKYRRSKNQSSSSSNSGLFPASEEGNGICLGENPTITTSLVSIFFW